jgi:glycosyltransferase involved in cell wall biosynthesis
MELISVLMASDRITKYLEASIQSLLDQTYVNIEIIFICNGDKSNDICNYLLEKFKDQRLKIFKTPIRQLAYSLNLGLSLSKGNVVARMDSDDISVPERLQMQYEYLINNNMDLVGSFLELINTDDNFIGRRKYPIGDSIVKKIYLTNPFAHNTIVCYKNVLINNRGYLGGFNTEDYDMWLRLKVMNIRWDNLPLYLVKYRVHNQSSQRSILSYAEASSHIYREFLLHPSLRKFYFLVISFFKVIFLSNKSSSSLNSGTILK